jgi:acetylglutamate kinase
MSTSQAKAQLNKAITGGMMPKVESCLKALDNGLEHANIIDGNAPHSLLIKLLTESPIGTTIFSEDIERN